MVTRARLAVFGSLAVALGILVVAPSCGSGFLDGLSGGKKDGGTDANGGTDTGAFDARVCSISSVPAPPADQLDTDVPGTVVLAFDGLRIDDNQNADASLPPSIGFDLDNACTCPEPETCTPPPDAGAKKCDGDGGTDNSIGRMFSTIGSLSPDAFGPDFATTKLREGSYSALMAIGGWNREANDPKVYVSFFLSQGIQSNSNGPGGPPLFDGNDTWKIDPASVKDGDSHIGGNCETQPLECIPVHTSSTAYVTDNTLVARVNVPLAISANTGRITIQMEDVTFVARLRKEGDLFRAEGELVGRWPANRILKALGEVPVNDKPLCEQGFLFDLAKGDVCSGVDLMSDPAKDHKGERCDSVSASFRFTAGTAKRGTIEKPDLPANACQTFNPTCD